MLPYAHIMYTVVYILGKQRIFRRIKMLFHFQCAPHKTKNRASRLCFRINQGAALYIINFKRIAYHQHEVLHLIKPQEELYTALP